MLGPRDTNLRDTIKNTETKIDGLDHTIFCDHVAVPHRNAVPRRLAAVLHPCIVPGAALVRSAWAQR
jgi:hypothetical protein